MWVVGISGEDWEAIGRGCGIKRSNVQNGPWGMGYGEGFSDAPPPAWRRGRGYLGDWGRSAPEGGVEEAPFSYGLLPSTPYSVLVGRDIRWCYLLGLPLLLLASNCCTSKCLVGVRWHGTGYERLALTEQEDLGKPQFLPSSIPRPVVATWASWGAGPWFPR
jgi:hypothetical protein